MTGADEQRTSLTDLEGRSSRKDRFVTTQMRLRSVCACPVIPSGPTRCSRKGSGARLPGSVQQLISSSSVLHAGIFCRHTLHSASVGDIRAARKAGHSPATAPMTTDAPIPPPQASGGMTTPQCSVEA